MKCPSCGFYNLPNVPSCGRCGQALVGGGPAQSESFYPARARDRTVRQSVGARFSRVDAWLSDRSHAFSNISRGIDIGVGIAQPRLPSRPEVISALITWLLLTVAVIPGFAQLMQRRFVSATIWAVSTAAMAAVCWVNLRSPLLDLLLWPMAFLMIGSVFDVAHRRLPDETTSIGAEMRRHLRLFLLSLSVVFSWAAVVMWACSFAFQLILIQDIYVGGLEVSDVVVVQETATLPMRIRRGDIVISDSTFGMYDSGPGIETVIGLPGDRVDYENGQLYVNGAKLPSQPINRPDTELRAYNRNRQPRTFHVTIERGTFAIWRAWDGCHVRDGDSLTGIVRAIVEPAARRRWLH
jgi:hypothetical protein